jgi:hypothetical protein
MKQGNHSGGLFEDRPKTPKAATQILSKATSKSSLEDTPPETVVCATSVPFPQLELLCHKHFPCICPGKWMGSVSVVSFNVEHDLINQFLL